MNPEPVPAGSAVRARAGLKPAPTHSRGAGSDYSPPTISEVCSVAMTTDLTSL